MVDQTMLLQMNGGTIKKKRENSIVQSLFTGQFKSLVKCQICSFESSRFEPFSFLQLPLPDPRECTLQVLIFYCGKDRPPLHCNMRVPINGPLSDLLGTLEKLQPGLVENDKFTHLPRIEAKNVHIAFVRGSKAHAVNLSDKSLRYTKTILCCYLLHPQNMNNLSLPPLSDDAAATSTTTAAITITTTNSTATAKTNNTEEGNTDLIFSMNDRVSAFYHGDTRTWFPGCVVGIHYEKNEGNDERKSATIHGVSSTILSYSVKFDDGDCDNDVKSEHMKPLRDQDQPILLTAVHRRFESFSKYFFNSLRPVLFGYPIILRCIPSKMNGYELYARVWEATRHLIPGDPNTHPPEKHKGNEKGNGVQTEPQERGAFLGKARFIHSGDGYPKLDWGFQLRRITNNGFTCPWTEWTRGALGTELADGEERVHFFPGSSTIAIDWNPKIVNRLQDVAKVMQVHASVERCRRMDTKSLSLYECMDTFIRAEKLDGNDQVYCSKCKNHEDASKKVTLYRNPPVLVVHLKRFKYTQYSRGKITRMVTFPLENMDLRFVTPRKPREDVPLDLTIWEFLGGKLKEGTTREVSDNETVGEIKENTRNDLPAPLYDCIGVVNHYGDLGAGHYTSFAKNPYDNRWRCFDDNRVKIIDASQVVSNNAYILFYLRQDMRGQSFAPDFDFRMPSPEQVNAQLAARRKATKSGRCNLM